MLTEIGIVLALYVLARVVPGRWRSAARAARVFAAGAAIVLLVDFVYAAKFGRRLFSTATDEASKEPEESSAQGEVAQATQSSNVTVTRADGGSITTNLSYGIAVAKGSSLHREWIAVHDTRMPVQFDGTPGVTTVFVPEKYGGEYRYRTGFDIDVTQPVRSLEIRFLTFDVWGDHVRSLRLAQVADLPVGKRHLTGDWRLFDENDVEAHYASIGYVSRVRLADGRILEMDPAPVIEEARKFSEKFEAGDLDREPLKRGEKKDAAG